MTVKQNTDGSEEIVQETMADRLKKVQLEAWKKMRYVHEEASDSWAVAEEALYLHQPEPASADQDANGGSNAKGKAPETEADPLSQPGLPDLVDKVAQLRTAWDEDSMLETTSGIPRPQNVKIEISDDEPAAPAPKAKGKGKAVATTTTAKATPRGKRATNTNTAKAGSSRAKKNN